METIALESKAWQPSILLLMFASDSIIEEKEIECRLPPCGKVSLIQVAAPYVFNFIIYIVQLYKEGCTIL